MRLKISKSKNVEILYVIKTVYIDGKQRTKTVERLGSVVELKEKLNGKDPIKWAKEYIADLNRKEKEGTSEILVKYSPVKEIPKNEQFSFNGGYLFLQKIYHQLGLYRICSDISDRHKFTFDLDSILSRLVYGRIIFPSSKLATCELSKKFIEQPHFDIQHVYRALSVLSTESDFIQSSLYKHSLKISKRNTGILFYDCTNFFFEIEQPDVDGLRQYGVSKEHRPNPIVQMGLFMDGDGVPLAFSINKGNTNEQVTLKPLEKTILSDFDLSKFVVCTDAGLASNSNRKFNTKGDRAFVTTQSIKKLKKPLKMWALDPEGWKLSGSSKTYDISKLDEIIDNMCLEDKLKAKSRVFYKQRWINENGLEQKLIITYSAKYKDYQKNIRQSQIERAQKLITSNPKRISKPKQNDFKRFIKKTNCTTDGEIADNIVFSIDEDIIVKEAAFDGFYGVCTNLMDDASEIIKVNKRRWQIEECFRIMKSEFKSRPVYLSRDDRIQAHFTTCFISLIIYRLLEKKLEEKYTCSEIINGLRDMNFLEIKGEGYVPAYTRTDFTDDLHNAFGFKTHYQIVTKKKMKEIFRTTKK
ncbi:transposase [Vallitalea longa]|uniref:Transposase n=1 Tax=Vallitalea longa TaxID=2936439 RepID=A0A9W5YH32_9FIRM|nr:IS1634 family transposase [Vallitalea longa]GKX32375.1 transposase [Vallitalea longa]